MVAAFDILSADFQKKGLLILLPGTANKKEGLVFLGLIAVVALGLTAVQSGGRLASPEQIVEFVPEEQEGGLLSSVRAYLGLATVGNEPAAGGYRAKESKPSFGWRLAKNVVKVWMWYMVLAAVLLGTNRNMAETIGIPVASFYGTKSAAYQPYTYKPYSSSYEPSYTSYRPSYAASSYQPSSAAGSAGAGGSSYKCSYQLRRG